MAVNYHGLTIKDLKKVSSETSDFGYYSGEYLEIFYDLSSGDLWSKYQYSLGQNSWIVYADDDIIKIMNSSSHLSQQELADAVYNAVCAYRRGIL